MEDLVCRQAIGKMFWFFTRKITYHTGLRTCRKKDLSEAKLTDLIAHNLNALENIIGYNIKSGIRLFRISSDLNPAVSFYTIIETAMQKQAETGKPSMRRSMCGGILRMSPRRRNKLYLRACLTATNKARVR